MSGPANKAPFPWSIRLNGNGYMCAVGEDGAPLWSEGVPRREQAEGVTGEPLGLRDWTGGIGLREYTNTPEGYRMLYGSSAAAAYGGVDARYGGLLMPGPEVSSVTVDASD